MGPIPNNPWFWQDLTRQKTTNWLKMFEVESAIRSINIILRFINWVIKTGWIWPEYRDYDQGDHYFKYIRQKTREQHPYPELLGNKDNLFTNVNVKLCDNID